MMKRRVVDHGMRDRWKGLEGCWKKAFYMIWGGQGTTLHGAMGIRTDPLLEKGLIEWLQTMSGFISTLWSRLNAWWQVV